MPECRLIGYNDAGARLQSALYHQIWRPLISTPEHRKPNPQPKPSRRFNLKSKGFWAAPTAIIAITLHRFLGWQIPFPQSWLTNSVVAAIAEQLNDPEPVAYITLAVAYFAYWFAKENCAAAIKEFTRMGIAAYFKQIKEEVIAEEVAKGIAKAEARGESRGESRGISKGRQSAFDELRALPPHEVLALLERQDTDPNSDSNPESRSNGNDQPPPA